MPPSPVQLQDFEPFDALSAEGRRLLSRALVQRTARRKESILYEGQPVSGAYVVLEGCLRVFTVTPSGNEATLYLVQPGETCVLALNCLFNDLLYPAWVEAEASTRVAVVPGAVYRQLFESETAVRNLTVRSLTTLVFRLMDELGRVHAGNHRQRLAHLILQHSDTNGRLAMTQQQIAGHLGTTREVVARLMQDLTRRGLVRTRRGMVEIRDLFRLRELTMPPRK